MATCDVNERTVREEALGRACPGAIVGHLMRPRLVVDCRTATFNRGTIEALKFAQHVRVSIDRERNTLLVERCDKEDPLALWFYSGDPRRVRWGQSWIRRRLAECVGQEGSASKRVYGRYLPEADAVVFDLSCAVVISRKGRNGDDKV